MKKLYQLSLPFPEGKQGFYFGEVEQVISKLVESGVIDLGDSFALTPIEVHDCSKEIVPEGVKLFVKNCCKSRG